MKQRALFICALACTCWGQVKPVTLEMAKPVSVKLETSPPSIWQLPIVTVLGGALVTLLGVLVTSLMQRKHGMRQWRADKQLEVLSRIGQLVVQTNHALRSRDEKLKRAVKLRNDGALSREITKADDDSAEACKLLTMRREELAALVGSAGFALSDTLWNDLQSLEQSFADVCVNERNTDTARTAQLDELDKKIKAFNSAARREVESLSGRMAAVSA